MNTITAEIRNPEAKARQLRRAGLVPCAVYGGPLPASLSIQIEQSAAKRLLRGNWEGSKVEMELAGETILTQIKDVARSSVGGELEHIGFQALEAGKKVNSKAQIVLLGQELIPGFLEQMLFELPYAALPSHMLDTVTVDLAELPENGRITVADLPVARDENIELLLDADSLVLRVHDRLRA